MENGQDVSGRLTTITVTLPTRRVRDVEYLAAQCGLSFDEMTERLIDYGAPLVRRELYTPQRRSTLVVEKPKSPRGLKPSKRAGKV